MDARLFHPAFAYEALRDLLVLALLLVVLKRAGWRRPGGLVLIYLAAYSVGRFAIEALRADANVVAGGWRLAMLVSAALTIMAVGGLLARRGARTDG